MLYRLLLLSLFWFSARGEIVLQEKLEALPAIVHGPWVRTGDGEIWAMDPKGAQVSRNEGRTWEPREIFDVAQFEARAERALLRTKEGVVLYAFLNRKEQAFKWDDKKGGPQDGCRLPVYLSRSSDDGRTWAPPILLQDGWCGAVRQMIQLKTGRIVLVSQYAMANPGRHATVIHYSDDVGATWHRSETIDMGDAGNYRDPASGLTGATHGGAIEGTVLEKRNGELKLLLRVPHGCFYESSSKDGVRWSTPTPSTLEASDSPGMMTRLASGRIVLVWNQFRDPVKRLARREQLSIAFSENDGLTWTVPQVIAINPTPSGTRESAYWISYPYLFEVEPGRLWVSTMQGRLAAALQEKDFIAPQAKPLEGPAVRILTLGDSITRGARPGVHPQETFGARLQGSLRAGGAAVQVHNVGIGGERTDLALARLERDVLSQRPRFVTVMYGTNDSWVDSGKSASRLTEQQYESNLRELVRRLAAAEISVVLMTPPKFAEQNPRNGAGEDPNVRLQRYVELCRKVARETGTPLVDHFAGWDGEQTRGRMLQPWTTDGCHPNAQGHADLAARIAPVLEPLVRARAQIL
jgi:sialidase-1